MLGAFLVWWVPYKGLGNLSPHLPLFFALILIIIVVIAFLGTVLLILTVSSGKGILFSQKLRWVLIKVLFPVIIFIGKIFGISKEEIQRSFLEMNNHLVRAQSIKSPPERVLILLPHCVQLDDCQIKITREVRSCLRCGQCEIKGLVELAEQYGTKIHVATGGSIARRIIVEKRPKIIIAVACERDITSGIQDSFPIPVLGILNERPFGHCINTRVNLNKVKEAVLGFLKQ